MNVVVGESSLPFIAVKQQRGLAIIRKLLNAGAILSGGELVDAVISKNDEVTGYLLSAGADILAPGTHGMTVLDAAALAGNLQMVRRYIDSGGCYNSEALRGAVGEAERIYDYRVIQYLFQCRPLGPLDAAEVDSFVQAILAKNHILVDMFLSLQPERFWNEMWPVGLRLSGHNRKLTWPWVSPLWAAAYTQQELLVNELVLRNHPSDNLLLGSAHYNQKFASKDIRQRLTTAYPLASIGDEESLRDLLISAINFNVEPELFQHHLNILKYLNFDVYEHCLDDYIFYEQRTLLQTAALRGSLGCVRVLLTAGANINAPASSLGQTALQAAIQMNNLEMTTLLLDSGADVNAPGGAEQGCTALQCVVLRKNLELAILLLERGADVNGPPAVKSGQTAIELAAQCGLVDISALLLQHLNVEGPLRIHFVRAVLSAEQGCHSAIVELLKKHGGWTEEDRRLATTPQATTFRHTCPRFLYGDESWNGECQMCDDLKDSSNSFLASCSSGEDDRIILETVDSIDVEEQPMQSEVNLLEDDLTMLQDPLEESIFGDMEVAPSIIAPYDATERWLDDLARDYIDSLV